MVQGTAGSHGAAPGPVAPSMALGVTAVELYDGDGEQFGLSLARLLPKLGSHLERARRVTDVRDVTGCDVAAWIDAPLPGGGVPSLATRHNRRSAARLGFRLLRQAGIVDHDPTVDLVLPSRSTRRSARPLTTEEIGFGRAASIGSLTDTRRPALWALAEATATTHEIPRVLPQHVDLATRTVWLSGSNKIEPRDAALADWGVAALERRLDQLDTTTGPLVYQGAGKSEAGMQAAASNTIRRILGDAGLRTDPGVVPASIRAWAGLEVFRDTGRIEEVAIVLGCHSLDTAAAIIGFDWQDQQ